MDDEIPDPGDGNDENHPQKVLFIITDGVSDENLPGMGRTHRELQQAHLDQCKTIKDRGIRIAILYTEYLPESLTGDSWSQSNVAPHRSEEHTSELQSLMRLSYAVFCLKQKNKQIHI